MVGSGGAEDAAKTKVGAKVLYTVRFVIPSFNTLTLIHCTIAEHVCDWTPLRTFR
jgi:hypothetical protein